MINNLVQQVQSQLLPQDDMEQYNQHLKTLDESNNGKRKDLIKKLNDIYDTASPQSNTQTVYNQRVLDDLEFYKSKGTPLFDIINKTKTSFGEKYIRKLFATPLDDIILLKERQAKIRLLQSTPKLYKDLTAALDQISDLEQTILWFWNPQTPEVTQLHDMIYYNIPAFEYINENTLFMQLTNLYKIFAAPAITTLSPIITLILPFIFLKIFGIDASVGNIFQTITDQVSNLASKFSLGGASLNAKPSAFIKYMSIAMWVVFYLQGAYSSILSAYNTNRIINNIHEKTNKIAQFIQSHTTLLTHLTKSGIKTEHIQSQCTLAPIFDHPTFKTKPQLLSNKGIVLTAYYKLFKIKDQLIPAMQLIGEIDAYTTITSLINHHHFNFVEFIDPTTTTSPTIKLKNVYHPVIPYKRVTRNSVSMSQKTSTHHLITGPNKAGKSTYIKSVIIALILGQTLTISNSSRASFTPFSYIDSYLNIPDCEGKESLYEAELNRCHEHLQTVAQYKNKQHKYMFTIMDEIFSSTNNHEGYAAAFAILKNLAKQKNCANIVTTHYYELSNLETETKKRIHNYKFRCEYQDDDTIIFDYKISRGASDQYIALKLLKDKGFDKSIIEDAYKVFNSKKTTETASQKAKNNLKKIK